MSSVARHNDAIFMRRALELARNGRGRVSPNPLVGAVIVADGGRIIGEGFHRTFGEAHAEVNAVASVSDADRRFLPGSTVYVTLEPCCHFGKTPPCSDLLVRERVGRVVIGCRDPFEKVDGGGIKCLQDNGIEVTVGVEESHCRSLNAVFMTAHTLRRPFVTLKWARSSDGFMDVERGADAQAIRFSDAVGTTLVHRLRSLHGAIGVGSGTAIADSPRLDVRSWIGRNPQRVIFDRRGRRGMPTGDIGEMLESLYAEGVTSILIEGGPTLLQSLIDSGLWDMARVEVSPTRLGSIGTAQAPRLYAQPFRAEPLRRNNIYYYSNNPLVDGYFVDNAL